MRAEWLALALGLTACDSPTLVELKIVPKPELVDPVEHLTVNVFEPHGLIATQELVQPRLPGTLSVRLKDLEQEVRLVAVATPFAVGAVSVTTTPHRSAAAELRLGSLPDGDGDGVPDVVDVCPTVADPRQASVNGGPPGDACATSDAGVNLGDGGVDGGQAVDAGLRGPSRCPVPAALWCEGFEGTLAGYPLHEENGSVRIETSPVARGSGSLFAQVPDRSVGFGYATARNETVIGSEDDWVLRAFVYAPSTGPPRGADMLVARYSGDYKNVAFGMSSSSRFQLARTLGAQTQVTPSDKTFPFDRWVCVELMHTRRNGRVGLRVFVDGVEDQSLALADLPVPNRFDQLLVGVIASPVSGASYAGVFVDEVLVTTARVGCAE